MTRPTNQPSLYHRRSPAGWHGTNTDWRNRTENRDNQKREMWDWNTWERRARRQESESVEMYSGGVQVEIRESIMVAKRSAAYGPTAPTGWQVIISRGNVVGTLLRNYVAPERARKSRWKRSRPHERIWKSARVVYRTLTATVAARSTHNGTPRTRVRPISNYFATGSTRMVSSTF